MQTDAKEFIGELSGGVLEQKLGAILSEVASGVIDHNKAGQVVLTLDLKRIGNSYQVAIKHKISYKVPTANGDRSENNTTETPMHVGSGGKLTLFPENQHQMFDMTGEVKEVSDNG